MAAARSPRNPFASWPAEMRSETAAAYVDEPSVQAFLRKVEQGVYSAPGRQRGCLPKWLRLKLDQDIARRHGVVLDGLTLPDDVTELI